ncbi:MAG: hypothetical protein QOI46_3435 [Alphaproteobacteria bacterium]|nr:hypothetical protein [Alphaproteobacteria bacterium]
MLRLMMLGLLIPLGVGVLAAMELKTPARSAAVPVRPVAEIAAGISEPRGALAKADRLEKGDRLEVAAASIETPAQPALVDERNSPPEGTSVGPSEPPRVINPHRHDPTPKKVATAASPKSKPKKAEVKRTTTTERRKAAGNTEPCRLSAFGGLLKALGSADCEI